MSGMGEERCRDLLSRLARNCGWRVRVWTLERNGLVHKSVWSENRLLCWEGTTWADVWRRLLADLEYACLPAPPRPGDTPPGWVRDALPAWLRGCSSPEELELKLAAGGWL